MTPADAKEYLKRNGVLDVRKIDEILRGFNLNKPLYGQQLNPGDVLYQYIRNASVSDLSPNRGSWFSLAGASTSSLVGSDRTYGARRRKWCGKLSAFGEPGNVAPTSLERPLIVG